MKRYPLNPSDPGHPGVALAGAVISTAMKGMRDYEIERIGDRIDSTVWLGSKSARRWFDIANVDQEYALLGMDWTTHAADLLAGNAARVADWLESPSGKARPLVGKRLKLLERGIEHFRSSQAGGPRWPRPG